MENKRLARYKPFIGKITKAEFSSNTTMETGNIRGISKLSQIIEEVSVIEKCSICLEKLEDTVLLRPCGHWFCRKCITAMLASSRKKSVSCPLCKSSIALKDIMPYTEKQQEYAGHLQTLIASISLDLGFDITSFNKTSGDLKSVIPTTNHDTPPIRRSKRKTSVRVVEVKPKPVITKVIKRSKKTPSKEQPQNNQSIQDSKFCQASSLESPEDPKISKVEKWLQSSKFSQAELDERTNTVVVEIHNTEIQTPTLSEEQLQSVTQVDSKCKTPLKSKITNKTCVTPSDIDAIKPFEESKDESFNKKHHNTNVTLTLPTTSSQKFDKLLPEETKCQIITATYGSKNTRKSRKSFAVDLNVFDDVDMKEDEDMKYCDENFEKSQNSLEDFSSGSGELWCDEQKAKKGITLKKDRTSKKTKNKNLKKKLKSSKQSKNEKCELYITIQKQRLKSHKSQCDKSQLDEKASTDNTTKDETDEIKKNLVNSKSPEKMIVQNVISDWEESQDNELWPCFKNSPKKKIDSVLAKSIECIEEVPENVNSPLGNIFSSKIQIEHYNTSKTAKDLEKNKRSPGWSRLKSTKKEFHLSEKKKLSLKTLCKPKPHSDSSDVGMTFLSDDIKCLEDVNKSNVSNIVPQEEQSLRKATILPDECITSKTVSFENKMKSVTNESQKQIIPDNLNATSTSLDLNSPFKGFLTQENKDRSQLDITNKNSHSQMEVVEILNDCKMEIKNITVNNLNINENNEESVLKTNTEKVDDSKTANETLCGKESKQKEIISDNLKATSTSLDLNSLFKGFLAQENKCLKDRSQLDITLTNKNSHSQMEVVEIPNDCKMEIENITVNNLHINENNEESVLKTNTEKVDDSKTANEILCGKESKLNEEARIEDSSFMTKKRDRDSGINESGLCSPVRKKICVDAGIQTSPGRHESFLKDMVKSAFGINAEDLFEKLMEQNTTCPKKINNERASTQTKIKNVSSVINESSKLEENFDDVNFTSSQNSDKENLRIPVDNKQFVNRYLNDSDIVLGTEDRIDFDELNSVSVPNYRMRNLETHKKGNSCILQEKNFLKENIVQEVVDVDPNAVTQPYKTPAGSKTTTNSKYTVVSNPTDSELKRVNELFSKDDSIVLNDTPNDLLDTPWNQSGIEQLGSSAKTAPNELFSALSKVQKKDTNRSRRQLDFVEEESNDMFDGHSFEKIPKEPSKTIEDLEVEFLFKKIGDKSNVTIEKITPNSIDESDDEPIIVFETVKTKFETVKIKQEKDDKCNENENYTAEAGHGQSENQIINNTLSNLPTVEVVKGSLTETPGIIWDSECQDNNTNFLISPKRSNRRKEAQLEAPKNIKQKLKLPVPVQRFSPIKSPTALLTNLQSNQISSFSSIGGNKPNLKTNSPSAFSVFSSKCPEKSPASSKIRSPTAFLQDHKKSQGNAPTSSSIKTKNLSNSPTAFLKNNCQVKSPVSSNIKIITSPTAFLEYNKKSQGNAPTSSNIKTKNLSNSPTPFLKNNCQVKSPVSSNIKIITSPTAFLEYNTKSQGNTPTSSSIKPKNLLDSPTAFLKNDYKGKSPISPSRFTSHKSPTRIRLDKPTSSPTAFLGDTLKYQLKQPRFSKCVINEFTKSQSAIEDNVQIPHLKPTSTVSSNRRCEPTKSPTTVGNQVNCSPQTLRTISRNSEECSSPLNQSANSKNEKVIVLKLKNTDDPILRGTLKDLMDRVQEESELMSSNLSVIETKDYLNEVKRNNDTPSATNDIDNEEVEDDEVLFIDATPETYNEMYHQNNVVLEKKKETEMVSQKSCSSTRELSESVGSDNRQKGLINKNTCVGIKNNRHIQLIREEEEVKEKEEEEKIKTCFSSSRLTTSQNQTLQNVLDCLKIPFSKCVGKHISHIVVGTSNGRFENSYKILHAMALHKPIITFDWVQEVIRERKTVPLDPYIARDASGECGVLRAKNDKKRELLKLFAIHVYNVNNKIVTKDQLEYLISLCGGTVVKNLSQFNTVPLNLFRIIILSVPPDTLTQQDWREKYRAVEVQVDWLYTTIARYRLVSLLPFTLNSSFDETASYMRHIGFPKELIFQRTSHSN